MKFEHFLCLIDLDYCIRMKVKQPIYVSFVEHEDWFVNAHW